MKWVFLKHKNIKHQTSKKCMREKWYMTSTERSSFKGNYCADYTEVIKKLMCEFGLFLNAVSSCMLII